MNSPGGKIKALVIDDSALYRKIVRDVLQTMPDVEVVGTASNGKIGLERIAQLKPDVITLDFEMPELDGIGVLRALAKNPDAPAAIMVSAFTASGAEATTNALQEGAFDFILKPATKSLDQSVQQLKRDLTPKIMASKTSALRRPHTGRRLVAPKPAASTTRTSLPKMRRHFRRAEIIGIGVSTGGPQALSRLVPQLPADFPAPIVLVQHMPAMFTESLARDLDRRSAIKVSEAQDGQPLQRGELLIAPGGKQMKIAKTTGGATVQITNDPPERNCKPSVDYLFRSLADNYGPSATGVILTGMGDDGTVGATEMKKHDSLIIAQDEASCVVYGMPKSIVDAELADIVCPLNLVAGHLVNAVTKGVLV